MTAIVAGRTLVLNKNWMPVNIISVFDAIKKVCANRALFLDMEKARILDEVECTECGGTWQDVYVLAGVQALGEVVDKIFPDS